LQLLDGINDAAELHALPPGLALPLGSGHRFAEIGKRRSADQSGVFNR
jgi:hypothetical protein